jgi:hypothetical protein
MAEPRIVVHFSCGAASAVAAKLALSDYPRERVVILNAFIKEEDDDNRRFLADCEKWFEHPVIVLRDEKYGASAREVWRKHRFIKNRFGAKCSQVLKRDVIEAVCTLDDRHVYGFTIDEPNQIRVKKFLDAGGICPLIDRNLRHADCLAMVERAGLVLPLRYRQGFRNANCRLCCKAGMGATNLDRKLNPQDFEEVAGIEAELGPGSYLFFNRETLERFPLTQLDPNAGTIDEPASDCSLFCAAAENEL